MRCLPNGPVGKKANVCQNKSTVKGEHTSYQGTVLFLTLLHLPAQSWMSYKQHQDHV